MFKSSLFSIFGSTSKPTKVHKGGDVGDIPKAFTISDDKQLGHNNNKTNTKLLNISMDQEVDDDFVNIHMNEMTYAEVAKLSGSGSGPVSSPKSVKPVKVNMNACRSKIRAGNSSSRLEDGDDMDDSIHEKFKSDIHYKKHKQFKANEKKKHKKHKKRS